MQENETIIQITSNSNDGMIYGLSNKGILYYFNKNINNWTVVGE